MNEKQKPAKIVCKKCLRSTHNKYIAIRNILMPTQTHTTLSIYQDFEFSIHFVFDEMVTDRHTSHNNTNLYCKRTANEKL